jgi:hypothetical protein
MMAVAEDLTPFVAGLSLVLSLLTAPLVWMHYLVLALPLGFVLMHPRYGRTSPSMRFHQIAAVIALSLIGALPWEWLLRVKSVEGEALLLWTGLGGLFALAIAQLLNRSSFGPIGK